MPVNKILPVIMLLLLVGGIAKADYTCQPIDISIIITPLQVYPYNQPFTISADITNNPSSNIVHGQIIDSSGRVTQEVVGTKNPFANTWAFNFNGVDVGDYTIKIYLTHPASGQTISKTITFSIKTPLAVVFSIDNQIQYIGTDIKAQFTVSPSSVSLNKALRATVDGIEVPVSPSYVDKGGGTWEVLIPKSQLTTEGILNLYLTLSDTAGKYNQVTRSIEGLTLTKAQLVVKINLPSTAKTGDTIQIKINLVGIGGTSINVDKASDLTLEITLPNGGKEVYSSDKFINSQTGEYLFSYKLLMPQNYYFRASAFKTNYGSGANTANLAVSGGSLQCGNGVCDSGENEINCPADCAPGYCGDGICKGGETSDNCPADCGQGWWIWIVVGVIAIISVILIIWKVKK